MHLANNHFYHSKNYLYSKPVKGLQGYEVGYGFSFNGQEKDDEVAGAGNTMTAEFWEYDSRLGRRWNVDPKPNPSISDYACFMNNPIYYNDVNGDSSQYFDSKGNLLHSSTDKLPNSIVIISDKALGAFKKQLEMNKSLYAKDPKKYLDVNKDDKPNSYLRRMGTVFQLDVLRGFYNSTSKDVNNTFVPTDGKGKISNEHGSFMVNVNGKMQLSGDWPGSPIDNWEPANKPLNMIGKVHTHPAEGRSFVYKPRNATAQTGDAGLEWDLDADDKRLNSVVSKSQIYFYTGNKIIIKVNGSFFKNQ